MQMTAIGWTDYSSNPIKYRDKETGKTLFACVHASPGCIHCYAESLGLRFGKGRLFRAQNMRLVEPFVDEKELQAIIRLKGPARVFVGDMTDLWGEWVPFEMLDRVFAAFALNPSITGQFLTKRSERLHEYMLALQSKVLAMNAQSPVGSGMMEIVNDLIYTGRVPPWPLPNVWLGVSAEDQQRADERIPWLMKTPAAVRFVSYEPALAPVDFSLSMCCQRCGGVGGGTDFGPTSLDDGAWDCSACEGTGRELIEPNIDWLIIGGESGPKRRPFDLKWARDAVRQCADAEIAVYFKQTSALRPGEKSDDPILDSLKEFPRERPTADLDRLPVEVAR